MARLGMDVDIINAKGAEMKTVGGSDLPQLISSVDSLVQQMHSNWHGADSESFVNAWTNTFKPNLTAIATAVEQHGQLAITNASEQATASSATTIA